MFQTSLLIDDDQIFTLSVKSTLCQSLNTKLTIINDFKNIPVKDILDYDMYIVRLNKYTVPVIKELSDQDKIIILTTENDDEDTRTAILSYHVTDYIITDSFNSGALVCKIAKQLQRNADKTVLIVDDSKLILSQISLLLDTQKIKYIKCKDGKEAWQHLTSSSSKKIDLVISDYEMPNMNGFELLKNIRTEYSLDELPVLILSGTEDTFMISKFLKAGANDYIPKPFMNEEFLGRLTNTLSMVDMFDKIKNMAMTDHLTGLNNRVYFYDTGSKILNIEKRAGHDVSIAMIDIDNFKKVNDTYGHQIGDNALVHVANALKKALRNSDILVRFGGEEFVILLPNCPLPQAEKLMNKVCKAVETSELTININETLKLTISIGVTAQVNDIDKMVEKADEYMYIAKNSGKNRVYTEK